MSNARQACWSGQQGAEGAWEGKGDVLKTLDPALRGVNKMAEYMQTVRKFLRLAGLKENTEIKLILHLTVAMTQDTPLIMKAMSLQQRASSNAYNAQAKMRESFARVSQKHLIVDSELIRAIERAELKRRMASI